MGGEGREILLDGLVVADVGQHGIEDGKLGAVGGDGNAGLRHQSQQADGFQGHGFAAGVGAGDDQLAAVAFEFDADGNDVSALWLQVAFQQWVAGLWREARVGFRCEAARFASRDSRGGCPHVSREATVTGTLTATQS